MKKISFIKLAIVLGVIGIDLVTKEIFYGTDYTIIPYVLGTRATGLNTGAAWSIFSNLTWLLILFSFVFVVGIAVFDFFSKFNNKIYSVGISFVLGGAIGNLIDRIFLNGVRDFIYFDFWQSYPTFNMADTFLIIGIILIAVYIIFLIPQKEKNEEVINKDDKELKAQEKKIEKEKSLSKQKGVADKDGK